MYMPDAFVVTDIARLQAMMRAYPFGTLLTAKDGAPMVSHLPFLLDAERGEFGALRFHLARANPHWRHFGESEARVMFHGPHAYISPTWYTKGPAVPTWNYAVVHAYGVPQPLDAAATLAQLRAMVEAFDPAPPDAWPEDDAARKFRDGMVENLVAFDIPIASLEGKFKMSQNRPLEDRPRIVAALSEMNDPLARETAKQIPRD